MNIDFKATGGAFLIGTIFVVLFGWINGNLAAPTFPLLAMTSAYILAGATIGFMSEGETVLEPVIATVLVALVSSFIIGAMGLDSFSAIQDEGSFSLLMTLVSINGLVLTFLGAWAGEQLQRTYAPGSESTPAFEWPWVAAGTVLGVAVSLLLANLEIRIVGAIAGQPFAAFTSDYVATLFVVLVLGLLATGYFCAFRSPGRTQLEAGLAGMITAVILLDIFAVGLAGTEFLTPGLLIGCLLIGIGASLAGGFFGEVSQKRTELESPGTAEA